MSRVIAPILGGLQLGWESAGGIVGCAQSLHAAISQRCLPIEPAARDDSVSPSTLPGPVSRTIYQLLRGTCNGVAEQLSRAANLGWSGSSTDASADTHTPFAPQLLAALNGVCGDHLDATGNPLAIRMSLRSPAGPCVLSAEGVRAAFERPSPHLALWIHGLCLSERSWERWAPEPMATRLHAELDLTPVYVRYNSGLRISDNAMQLSDRVQQLVELWPTRVESITLIGHSMGGLLARSTAWHAEHANQPWRGRLRRIVCLGAPHHGASLERSGHWITRMMQASPYVAPFAVGDRRSAGIKDLRFGNLTEADWQAAASDTGLSDSRIPMPLAADVEHFFAAASIAREADTPLGQVLGDLLVSPGSAIGRSSEPARHIEPPATHCRLFLGRNHFDLLGHPEVYDQLLAWLS